MATPGELIKAMASVLGIPEGTVFQFDRQLSEAGLRSKSGRGRSAARVTAEDAANLVIAIGAAPLSGPAVKDAASTVETYGSLRVRVLPSVPENFANVGLPCLSKLPTRHTLRRALTALIDGTAKGEAFGVPDEGKLFPADLLFSIRFVGSEPWADIIGDGTVGSEDAPPEHFARIVYHRASPAEREWHDTPDLHQERHVTFKTIRRLAEVIR